MSEMLENLRDWRTLCPLPPFPFQVQLHLGTPRPYVAAGLPHHVRQRANRRQATFFEGRRPQDYRKRRVFTVWTTSSASSRPTANIREDITNMSALKHSKRSLRSVEIDNPSGKSALYKHFFDRLIDELRDKHEFTNAKAGAPKNWHTFSAGTGGFTYAAVFASGGRIRVEVYIDFGKRASNVAALEVLQAQEPALSEAFAEPLQWELLKGKQACRIAVYRSGTIEDTAEFLEEHHRWIAQRLLLFKEVFGARLAAVAQEAEKRAISTP
jgi:hypothetical protein